MRIVVVGGGPAGMMASIAAARELNKYINNSTIANSVILLEKNEKLGKKLFITGKGRCNVTNACDKETFLKNIVSNSKFMFSSFAAFSNADLQKFLEENGCKLKIERGDRVFPVSDKAYSVTDALKKAMKDASVDVKLNAKVNGINKENDQFILDVELEGKKKNIIADKVIVATGGLSYSSTGSTGDGYRFAEKFGINVVKTTPSLVPLNIVELDECMKMQGLTLKNVAIEVYTETGAKKKIIYKDFGEMLFTHFGMSGPIILSASCFLDDICDNQNLKKIVKIDLKPALSEEQLDLRLLREFEENKNKKLKSVIEGLLPNSMVMVFIDRLAKIRGTNTISDIKISEVDKTLRKEIIKLLKNFIFTIKSKRGFDEAIITKGGIDVKELNPKTMESKKVKGLYFVGETIDVDCLTGGFNITTAMSTAYAAGLNVRDI